MRYLNVFRLFSCLCLEWQVEVMNPDETPADRVMVVVEPGDVRGTTAANGIAKLTLNTEEGNEDLRITVSPQDVLKVFTLLHYNQVWQIIA